MVRGLRSAERCNINRRLTTTDRSGSAVWEQSIVRIEHIVRKHFFNPALSNQEWVYLLAQNVSDNAHLEREFFFLRVLLPLCPS